MSMGIELSPYTLDLLRSDNKEISVIRRIGQVLFDPVLYSYRN